LREPANADLEALVDLLSFDDSSRFGIDGAVDDAAIQHVIARAAHERQAGASLTYVVASTRSGGRVIGLVQVRALDPAFETAEWEMALTPSARGSGAFIETARLVVSFVFSTLGTHRLEARVQVQNGRANGALRKIGAVQEGILRRAVRRRGEYVDQVLWAVLKDDWSERPEPTAPRVH
jgi:RimJ/RimL family protein N-acetyltransferase